MYLSARERKLVEYLLDAQTSIAVKTVAAELHVSERTVYRDLTNIEQILFDYNLELHKEPGVGLQISGLDSDKNTLHEELRKSSWSEFTSEERREIILSILLQTDEPVKLFTLASNLNVSTATVSHDLDQLENDLTNDKLQLIRRRGYGVGIQGTEADKRAAISRLISQQINESEMVSLLKQRMRTFETDAISNRLLGLVNPEKLSVIEQQVQKAKDKLHYDLADRAYIGLVVHLALAIERLQKGDIIEVDPKFLNEISETSEYIIARELISGLEYELDMTIPDDEIGYITMHLMGAKLQVDQHYMIEDSSLDVAYQAKEIINYVSNRLDKDLTYNIALLNDLVAHLKPSIYRLKKGMTISNPMLNDIKNDYSDLFNILQNAVASVFPDLLFPEDEIAFLVLHFAAVLLHDDKDINMQALVICSSGIGTAKILANKLKQQIPEIKQVDNRSLFELENIAKDDYDIIVSTVPLEDEMFDYILASPMLAQQEADNVKREVRKRKASMLKKHDDHKGDDNYSNGRQQLQAVQAYSTAILQILQSLQVNQQSRIVSVEQLLQIACKSLATSGVIQSAASVSQKLINRQSQSGLGIPGSNMALYHARTKDILQPSFTVYKLDKPLSVKGMDESEMIVDTLLLMLAPSDAGEEILETFSFLSSLIIEDDSINVLESGNAEQIEDYLSKQFLKWFNETIM